MCVCIYIYIYDWATLLKTSEFSVNRVWAFSMTLEMQNAFWCYDEHNFY